MNVIKAPTHQCEWCSCVYEFNKTDFKEEKKYIGEHQANGFCSPKSVYEHRTYVECPVCNSKFVIKSMREER